MLVTPTTKAFGKYKPGMSFTLPDKAANHLIRAGILRASDESNSVEVSPRTGLPKRQYRRRDLQAES